jgi:prophage regulatory protein
MTLPEVLGVTKISRSTLYGLLDRGDFPRPMKLGQRKNGWTDEQIDQWIRHRAKDAQAA